MARIAASVAEGNGKLATLWQSPHAGANNISAKIMET